MDLFNRFAQQSNVDIKNLDNNNHDLIGKFNYFVRSFFVLNFIEILETGWKDDRQLEHKSAQKDLAYIDDLTVLLKHTEKRKAKVGTIVHRLIGELQQLKYYLEGMSNPSTPALPLPSPGIILDPFILLIYIYLDHSSRPISSRRRRSISNERAQSAVISPTLPLDPIRTPRRPQSVIHGDMTAPTPIHFHDNVQQQVSMFVEDNFDIKTSGCKKTSKHSKTTQRSARTDFSSWKTNLTSIPSPIDDNDQRKTVTTPKIAFV